MTRHAGERNWVEEVLRYWFEELTPDDWFTQKDKTDGAITARFLPLYRSLEETVPRGAYDEPRTALAAIVVFDQLPRNMFRGRPEAFATDTLALDVAANALDRKFDSDFDEKMRTYRRR